MYETGAGHQTSDNILVLRWDKYGDSSRAAYCLYPIEQTGGFRARAVIAAFRSPGVNRADGLEFSAARRSRLAAFCPQSN